MEIWEQENRRLGNSTFKDVAQRIHFVVHGMLPPRKQVVVKKCAPSEVAKYIIANARKNTLRRGLFVLFVGTVTHVLHTMIVDEEGTIVFDTLEGVIQDKLYVSSAFRYNIISTVRVERFLVKPTFTPA